MIEVRQKLYYFWFSPEIHLELVGFLEDLKELLALNFTWKSTFCSLYRHNFLRIFFFRLLSAKRTKWKGKNNYFVISRYNRAETISLFFQLKEFRWDVKSETLKWRVKPQPNGFESFFHCLRLKLYNKEDLKLSSEDKKVFQLSILLIMFRGRKKAQEKLFKMFDAIVKYWKKFSWGMK